MVLRGVGATLREERLRRQFSVEHVSDVTRISARYLEAIENDRPEDLPGIVFTRGFVRQYARFLELPDEDLLSHLPKVDIENAALPVPPPKAKKPLWNPRWNLPAMAMGFAGVLVAAGVGAWFYFDLTPVAVAAARGAIAAASAARNERVRNHEQMSTVKAAAPAAAQPVETHLQPEAESSLAAQQAPAPGLEQPQVEPVPVQTVSAATGSVQVLLRANADAWVQVVADGKAAFTGMLHRNDSREVSGNQLVKVMTGNAGGLEISLNGRVLEPLGPSGQVRTVRLTAEGPTPDLKIPVRATDPL